MNKIYPKSFSIKKNLAKGRLNGFTLIELLVVVLIIGILSAVALPQYRVAVAKSRLAAIIPVVRGAKDSLEMYYMANGSYPPDAATDFGFDITLPSGCTNNGTTSGSDCPNGVIYDLLDYGTPNVLGINSKDKVGWLIWLDNSARPGETRCLAVASDATANSVCKSMGGREVPGEQYRYFTHRAGTPKVYALP